MSKEDRIVTFARTAHTIITGMPSTPNAERINLIMTEYISFTSVVTSWEKRVAAYHYGSRLLRKAQKFILT